MTCYRGQERLKNLICISVAFSEVMSDFSSNIKGKEREYLYAPQFSDKMLTVSCHYRCTHTYGEV